MIAPRPLLRSVLRAACCATLVCGTPAIANVAGVVIQPAQVRVEQYIGSHVAIWPLPASPFPGTSCNSFNFNGPATEVSRVFALVLAAKSSNRSFIVYYNTTNCAPVSVAMD